MTSVELLGMFKFNETGRFIGYDDDDSGKKMQKSESWEGNHKEWKSHRIGYRFSIDFLNPYAGLKISFPKS